MRRSRACTSPLRRSHVLRTHVARRSQLGCCSQRRTAAFNLSRKSLIGWLTIGLLWSRATLAADPTIEQARVALERGAAFFHQQVASHGGYVYCYSHDLTKREGEGKTDLDTVWVQPPGTPLVGSAFLEAYELTGIEMLLDAARDAADCLIQGQLHSGGWTSEIRFDPAGRRRFAYRVDPKRDRARNWSTFDDDKSQSAMQFLMQLDRVLEFQDGAVHDCIQFALQATLNAQFPNGAWPQGFRQPADANLPESLGVSYPTVWSRIYEGGDYWEFYTFNDNAIVDVMNTLTMAAEVYDADDYRAAVQRGLEFVLSAQLPDPQPAWAQQYDPLMRPTWARKFEPPAVSCGESQRIVGALLDAYEQTQDRRCLRAAGRAIAYLESSVLPGGKLARFYELQSNRPLFFTKDYRLTYRSDDLPTHYAFLINSRCASLRRRYDMLSEISVDDLRASSAASKQGRRPQDSQQLAREASQIVASQDDRGAWVEQGRLRYHGQADPTRQVIRSATFARNLRTLAGYISALQRMDQPTGADEAFSASTGSISP